MPTTTSRIKLLDRHPARLVAILCIGLLQLWSESGMAAERSEEVDRADQQSRHQISEDVARARRWFLIVGFPNSHPKLESEEPIKKYFDPVMRAIAPSYDSVTTVGDLRDDYLLWPPYFGIGRLLGNRLSVFWDIGYTAGKVRTKADDRSRLLLPLHTDFEIMRGAFYTGLGLDYFPLGMPELRRYDGWKDRFRNIKPIIGGRVTWTYATYDAKVKVGFKPFRNLVNLDLGNEWGIPSIAPLVGVEIPVGERSQIAVTADYNYFADRTYDFNGPAYTIDFKWFF